VIVNSGKDGQPDTPCLTCAVGGRRAAAAACPETKCGVGRLVAETALRPSIESVASFASQVALGMLAGPVPP
jgi:hypothetical protein